MEFDIFDVDEAKALALDNSRLFDVHTWSDHPEVDAFVDPIYENYFIGRKKEVRKRHVKVLLLDLYVAWNEDPERYIAISRNSNDYKAKTRYNALHISRLTIDVIDALLEASLIEQDIGFYNRDSGFGRLTRIRPTDELIKMFEEAKFGPLDISYPLNRETVVLRDRDPDDRRSRDIEYEDTEETRRMSAMLAQYNALLRATFIDIPTLEQPGIDYHEDGQPARVIVSHNHRAKFVRRIFNRGSFECGGRFFGGWWQRCPKEWRSKIFINDQPTNEIDYSGLHIVLLYASQGVNYWGDQGGDAYEIEQPAWLHDAADARELVKILTLLALNADTPQEAFRAFRSKASPHSWEKHLTNDQLGELLSAIEAKHPTIADMLNLDMGVHLMNWDSRISEIILEHFTDKSICVLSIHDSYIVPCGYENELTKVMSKAFEAVTGLPLHDHADEAMKEASERVENLEAALNTWMPYEELWWQDEDERALKERLYPERTDRYKRNLELYNIWRRN